MTRIAESNWENCKRCISFSQQETLIRGLTIQDRGHRIAAGRGTGLLQNVAGLQGQADQVL